MFFEKGFFLPYNQHIKNSFSNYLDSIGKLWKIASTNQVKNGRT